MQDPWYGGSEKKSAALVLRTLPGGVAMCVIGVCALVACTTDPGSEPDSPETAGVHTSEIATNSRVRYKVGRWDGRVRDHLAVRRGNAILMDTNDGGGADLTQVYGNGNAEDQYLFGDWDESGVDHPAVRRGNLILKDTNRDGVVAQNFGNGNAEDQYLVGQWSPFDLADHIAVRRGNVIVFSFLDDDIGDFTLVYGNGNSEDEYLTGDRDGDGFGDIAVRRGNLILWQTNIFGALIGRGPPRSVSDVYGNGNSEDEYLVGDWNGTFDAKLAVRRGNVILMDFNHDGIADKTVVYGNGNSETP